MESRQCWQPERWRAALSAMLDGEDPPIPRAEVEAHLAECGPCTAWYEQAGMVTTHVHAGVPGAPDLSRRIIGVTEAHICGCHRGEACECTDCQCPQCTCRDAVG